MFDLVETADGFTGVVFELILQRSGNLRTQSVDATEF
jgi:hypothetical protein